MTSVAKSQAATQRPSPAGSGGQREQAQAESDQHVMLCHAALL
jgi:hypothetical protein